MSEVKASVILVTWALDDYRMNLLAHTIESLRLHTDAPYRLIVVDNGLEPQTRYLRSILPDVHIVNKINQGPGLGRNQGAAIATTPYLAFVDNDVSFCQDWLPHSLAVLEEFPDTKMIVQPGKSRTMNDQETCAGVLPNGCPTYTLAGGWLWVMRRATFLDVGPFVSNEFDAIEDRNWCIRAREKGYVFARVLSAQCYHVGRHKSFSKTKHLHEGIWV
jgi:GT2 family glycosyltransferase